MNVDVLDLRSGFAMELKILLQNAKQVLLVKDDLRRIEPMTRSPWGFCHRGA